MCEMEFNKELTSCARGDTICLRPLQVDTVFAIIRQVAVLFRHNHIFVFIRQVGPVPVCSLLLEILYASLENKFFFFFFFFFFFYLRHQQQVDL